jgi:hypothetical protein
MSFKQLLIGKVGIAGSTQSTPTISLDPSTGTITASTIVANLNINANVCFTEPDVEATFQNMTLSDANILANSTADRLVVQLPNSNDVIKIGYDGRVGRSSGVGAGDWVIGAPEANNGYSFRINTSQANLQLYAPDSGGQVALYNTNSTGYEWVIAPSGDATFENITARANIFCNGSFAANGNCNINGSLQVNGIINGVVQSEAVAVFVNANYSVPNDGNNYELLINANTVGIGSGDLIITLPTDPIHQMSVNMSVVDLGTANSIAVGDGTPQIAFIANGLRTFVDLKLTGLSKTTFKHVSWGVNGDWWMVSPF